MPYAAGNMSKQKKARTMTFVSLLTHELKEVGEI